MYTSYFRPLGRFGELPQFAPTNRNSERGSAVGVLYDRTVYSSSDDEADASNDREQSFAAMNTGFTPLYVNSAAFCWSVATPGGEGD